MRTLFYLFICCNLMACALPPVSPEPLNEKALEQEEQQQFIVAFTESSALQSRLADVAAPLLKNNVAACRKVTRFTLGILLHNPSEYPLNQRKAAKSHYGDFNRVMVKHVIQGSAAEGRLLSGDRLLSINQATLASKTREAMKQIQSELQSGEVIELEIARQEEKLNLTLQPDKICRYPVSLLYTDAVNAYADGSRIMVTRGMMHFARNDSELALIIAHELAHNTRNHIHLKMQNAAIGGIADLLLTASGLPSPAIVATLSANLYNSEFEIDADLEGIRLMHKAGYPIANTAEFWRRMAALYPESIKHGKPFTHPTTAERYLRIKHYTSELLNAAHNQ